MRELRPLAVLADRHDWLAPFVGELGLSLACERLLGFTPPVRAIWARMLLTELSCIGSHLAFLGFVPYRLQDAELAALLEEVREEGGRLWQSLSGQRIHPMLALCGGLAADADEAWLSAAGAWADRAAASGHRIQVRIHSDEFEELSGGLALIDQSTTDPFGLSGPIARASGVAFDLRQFEGASFYTELTIDPPSLIARGDAQAGSSASAGRSRSRQG